MAHELVTGTADKSSLLLQSLRQATVATDIQDVSNTELETVPKGQSALDLVNTIRIIRKYMDSILRSHVGYPRDEITRALVCTLLDIFMIRLQAARRITDFKVQSDEANNPPSVLQEENMIFDVAFQSVSLGDSTYRIRGSFNDVIVA